MTTQPSVLLFPYVEGPQPTAGAALSPFRTSITPVFEQTAFAPTFNAVSHGSDEFLSNAPPRYIIGGAAFSELWDDVVARVFGEWVAYTEEESTKGSFIVWELWNREKVASVGRAETAFSVREPHYYVVANARYVFSSFLSRFSRSRVSLCAVLLILRYRVLMWMLAYTCFGYYNRHSLRETDAKAERWVSKISQIVNEENEKKTGKRLGTPLSLYFAPSSGEGKVAGGENGVKEIFGENLPRLKAVKAKYDPKKVWSRGWVVEPDPAFVNAI